MRTFVTGASGFIGQALCARLLEHGHEVSALVRRPGSEPPGTRGVLGDLSDGLSLSETIAAERPDCVLHLAAEIASQRSERKIFTVNVEGTARLLDACRALAALNPTADGPRVVFASTVVTGDAHGALLTEDTPLPVQTPYGRSKQEGERLVLESGLPVHRDPALPRLRTGRLVCQRARSPLAPAGPPRRDRPRREPVGRRARRTMSPALCSSPPSTRRPARPITWSTTRPSRSMTSWPSLREPWGRRAQARPGCARALDRRTQRGGCGCALGSLLERQDQAGARLGAPLPTAREGVADAVARLSPG